MAIIKDDSLDRVTGDVVFYKETQKTPFTGMINPDCHSYPGDATGRDNGGIIISMIAGAEDRTCIHEDTKHVIYIMLGYHEMTASELDEPAACIQKYAKTLAPAAEIKYTIY